MDTRRVFAGPGPLHVRRYPSRRDEKKKPFTLARDASDREEEAEASTREPEPARGSNTPPGDDVGGTLDVVA